MPDAAASRSPAADLDPRLAGTRFREIRRFTGIDSTNRYLLAVAARARSEPGLEGVLDGIVAVADEQTAGRGRHGRTWSAAPGSALLVSVLLRPALAPERLHLVTLAAAVAAADAVAATAGFEAKVKWPNDLVVDDRKLAGILAEADGAGAVVLGMGLNIGAGSFPAELSETATACELQGAGAVDRSELLAAWLLALDAHLAAIGGVVAAAGARSATLGRRVRVELAREQFDGTAARMTSDGYLVVRRDDGREQTVTAGDVIHLRPT